MRPRAQSVNKRYDGPVKRLRGQSSPHIPPLSLDWNHPTLPPLQPASCLPLSVTRDTLPLLRPCSINRRGPLLASPHQKTPALKASLRLDGSQAKSASQPRNWKETFGNTETFGSHVLPAIPLELRGRNAFGHEEELDEGPRQTRGHWDLPPASPVGHTRKPSSMLLADETTVWPSAQPRQTPSHHFSPSRPDLRTA